MSAFKVVASIIGLASIAAFVAKPVGVRSEVTAEVAPITVKEDRSEMFSSGDGWACAQEPWPYGCQWRTPSKRVIISRPATGLMPLPAYKHGRQTAEAVASRTWLRQDA
jgi:hypothetical protein